MEQKLGFRFQPTDEELINYYLKNKVMGNSCLVDDTISEINILNHHPSSLPSLSRIKSNDHIYYFFAPKQYRTTTTSLRKRSTNTWKWFMTGLVVDIKDKSGNKIGERQGLRFRDPKAPKLKGEMSRWIMHEYQITSLPHHNLDSYVICKIYDKGGKKADITNGNSSSELSPSLVSDSKNIRVTSIPPVLHNHPHVQLQTPYSDDYWSGLFQDMFSDQEFAMQENRNDYKPKKSLSGIIVDYSSDSDSDSDAESIPATSYRGTSSPGDSVGSSNRHSQTSLYEIVSLSKDIQTSDEPSISRKTQESQLARHTILLKQEVKQGMRKTEKKGLLITEEASERKREDSPYIYLINMIIGFILLLALIGDIISV